MRIRTHYLPESLFKKLRRRAYVPGRVLGEIEYKLPCGTLYPLAVSFNLRKVTCLRCKAIMKKRKGKR